MSKTSSGDLFVLIKSLNKAEKRYFKMFCRIHMIGGENKYVQLFDRIDKQKRYDESELRQFSYGGNFPVLKKFLYHQILKALRSFHGSINSRVHDLIEESEILFNKGLYEQAKKYTKKIKIIARQNDMYWALLEIYRNIEMNLALKHSDLNWVKTIMQEETRAIHSLQNSKTYRDLYFDLAIHYGKYGFIRHKEHGASIKKILKSKFLQDESHAETYDAKQKFYEAHGFYAQLSGKPEKVIHYYKKVLKHMEQNPQRIKAAPLSYIACLSNLITGSLSGTEWHDIPSYISKLEKIQFTSKQENTKPNLFFAINYYKLNYLNNMGRFNESERTIESFSHDLTYYEKKLNDFEKANLFANISISYFGVNNYNKSIFWMNKIRNEVSLQIREDLEIFFRIFYLIVHYESNNLDILPSLAKSLLRFLLKKKRLYKFESIILDFIRNTLPKTDRKNELREKFQKLRSKIHALRKDPHEKNIFQYFDYISWLDSKIENRTFAEAVKEKAEKIPKEENSSQN